MGGLSGVLDGSARAVATALVTVAVLLGVRLAISPLIGDPVTISTYFGVAGGFVGAVAMVVGLDVLGLSGPTPGAQFWARVAGDVEPGSARWPGLAVHLVYGAVAGAVYPRALWWALEGSMMTIPGGLLGGVIFGTILFVLALAFWLAGLYGMVASADLLARYYTLHLVYGVALGSVVGTYSLVVG